MEEILKRALLAAIRNKMKKGIYVCYLCGNSLYSVYILQENRSDLQKLVNMVKPSINCIEEVLDQYEVETHVPTLRFIDNEPYFQLMEYTLDELNECGQYV